MSHIRQGSHLPIKYLQLDTSNLNNLTCRIVSHYDYSFVVVFVGAKSTFVWANVIRSINNQSHPSSLLYLLDLHASSYYLASSLPFFQPCFIVTTILSLRVLASCRSSIHCHRHLNQKMRIQIPVLISFLVGFVITPLSTKPNDVSSSRFSLFIISLLKIVLTSLSQVFFFYTTWWLISDRMMVREKQKIIVIYLLLPILNLDTVYH